MPPDVLAYMLKSTDKESVNRARKILRKHSKAPDDVEWDVGALVALARQEPAPKPEPVSKTRKRLEELEDAALVYLHRLLHLSTEAREAWGLIAELPPSLRYLNLHCADVWAAADYARAAVKRVLDQQRSPPGDAESRERVFARSCVAACRAHGVPMRPKAVHAFAMTVWDAATAETTRDAPAGFLKTIEREIGRLKRDEAKLKAKGITFPR